MNVKMVVPSAIHLHNVRNVEKVNGELHVKVTAQLIVTIMNVLKIVGTARIVDVLMAFMVECVLLNAYLSVNHAVITTAAIHVLMDISTHILIRNVNALRINVP